MPFAGFETTILERQKFADTPLRPYGYQNRQQKNSEDNKCQLLYAQIREDS
jgi:hypothetical protein